MKKTLDQLQEEIGFIHKRLAKAQTNLDQPGVEYWEGRRDAVAKKLTEALKKES